MNRIAPRTLFSVLIAFLLVSGERLACSAADAKPADRPTAEKKVTALGTVEPETVVDVGAEVNGVIASFGDDPQKAGKPIDYGSVVEQGTVLARIDSEPYAAQVEQNRASCALAEAELTLARVKVKRGELDLRRAQDQQQKKALSDYELDSARINCEEARASVGVAEAMLRQNKIKLQEAERYLSYTTIRAPTKGVIIDRRVNVGQTVVSNLNSPSLFLLAAIDNLQVWASVNEADILRVHPQQAARFTVDAFPGKVFQGKVKHVRLNATMTQNVVTYTVVIAISNTPKELLPYMTAHVEFE